MAEEQGDYQKNLNQKSSIAIWIVSLREGPDLIVLMDNQFVQPAYSRSMPADWFDSDVNELVSDRILKDVTEFWEKNVP